TSLFFFSSRRRHTRFSRDWSSDVCSSDLVRESRQAVGQEHGEDLRAELEDAEVQGDRGGGVAHEGAEGDAEQGAVRQQEGGGDRSEERRVGKEGRCRGARDGGRHTGGGSV